jgi:hypothetical protein
MNNSSLEHSNSTSLDGADRERSEDEYGSGNDRLYCRWCQGFLIEDREKEKDVAIIQGDQLKTTKWRTVNHRPWPAACRMCSLIYDSILVLGFDIDQIQEVRLAYRRPKEIESVQTVSMRLTFTDDNLSDWYDFYCLSGERSLLSFAPS